MRRGIAIAAVCIVLASAAGAQAGNGIVGGVYGHVGVGRAIPSQHYSYNRGFYGGRRSAFSSGHYRSGYHGGYFRGHVGHGHGHHGHGHHRWHDTSHWDYYPGGYVRHYDHYDYVPPHWDWHQEGHWDHH
jgi:hypothetical protein